MRTRLSWMRRMLAIWVMAAGMFAILSATAWAQVDVPPSIPPSETASPLVFGMVNLTGNQTARLNFANIAGFGLPDRPVRVQLMFLDGKGQVLLQAPTEVVRPGRTTSLDLSGDGILPVGSNRVAVWPVVRILDPQARGLAALEIEDATTVSRFVLRPKDVTAVIRPPRPWGIALCAGPVGMRLGESARLTAVNAGSTTFVMKLSFTEIHPTGIGPLLDKTVTVDAGRSASLDLPQYVGTILASVSIVDRGSGVDWPSFGATLEVFDESLEQHTARIEAGMCDTGATKNEIGNQNF